MIGLLTIVFFYFIGVYWFFRAISYQCVMGITGYHDYSLKNFLLSLIFPITIIYLLISSYIEDKKYTEREQFERFKKKRLKEYKDLILTKDGIKRRKNGIKN